MPFLVLFMPSVASSSVRPQLFSAFFLFGGLKFILRIFGWLLENLPALFRWIFPPFRTASNVASFIFQF